MTDDTRTSLDKGADQYARRHPDKTPTKTAVQPTGSAAGRSAYERRHGTRTQQDG